MAGGHERIETNLGLMLVLVLIVISFGGLITITPLFFQTNLLKPVDGLEPYGALELEGRDIYIREGCYTCHSQMVRPFRAETERYGHYSVAGEYIYDRPFQWGSKRTGPDLQRVGGRYSDEWHRVHLVNPRDVVPESIMPGYPWLEVNALDPAGVEGKMRTLRTLGHPYTDEQIQQAPGLLEGKTEMDAMVAYLQSLGTHVKIRR
ncbi:MAG: cytochrome-c oxidase, cbb3-type subunit II [Ectothiorhodospiraceae bacterium]|nr:cytochrome-c oxidase, cbb3-type subunit II [Chromatiales bacterium]MCP5153781.1 cytochrome-c oxidase, cbb3-type subunit II [Ectothiorhodospiraceae bacterium]